MNKLAYDVILFEKCNMKCDHCFQIDHTKDWDLQVINNLPNKIYESFRHQYQARNNQLDLLTISFCGGELLADGISDDRLEIYKRLKNQIIDNIRQLYAGEIKFEMISNGVFTKLDRVVDFLQSTNSKISISYDPVSRYRSQKQKQIALNNIKQLHQLKLLDEISITLTKQSVEYYIDHDDLNHFRNIDVGINYFIASQPNNADMIASDDDYFRFWKYCLDHQYYNVKALQQFIDNVEYKENDSFCICDNRLIVRNGIITYNCAIYSSGYNNIDFYNTNNINEQTVRFVKKSLGQNKRGCNFCQYYNICPGMCWTSILFKHNQLSAECPNKRLIDLIINNVK